MVIVLFTWTLIVCFVFIALVIGGLLVVWYFGCGRVGFMIA